MGACLGAACYHLLNGVANVAVRNFTDQPALEAREQVAPDGEFNLVPTTLRSQLALRKLLKHGVERMRCSALRLLPCAALRCFGVGAVVEEFNPIACGASCLLHRDLSQLSYRATNGGGSADASSQLQCDAARRMNDREQAGAEGVEHVITLVGRFRRSQKLVRKYDAISHCCLRGQRPSVRARYHRARRNVRILRLPIQSRAGPTAAFARPRQASARG